MIRPATLDDAPAIARIYNHYVLNTTVTFEEVSVSDADMAGRVDSVQSFQVQSLGRCGLLANDVVTAAAHRSSRWHFGYWQMIW